MIGVEPKRLGTHFEGHGFLHEGKAPNASHSTDMGMERLPAAINHSLRVDAALCHTEFWLIRKNQRLAISSSY